jgi:hypothetical protein
MKRNEQRGTTRMSRFADTVKPKQSLDLLEVGGGQSGPKHYPQGKEGISLGAPLSIADVAALLGCSPWTIRQKYLPKGLPHLRASRAGKLVFFRNQVIDWILRHQSEGSHLDTKSFKVGREYVRKEQ